MVDEERAALDQYFPDYSMTVQTVQIIAVGHIRRFSDDYWNLRYEQVFRSLGVVDRYAQPQLWITVAEAYRHPGFANYAGRPSDRGKAELLDATMLERLR
ncbi:hypothetical protein LTR85_005439 [Meristemomyces frigidus]|nr:hypothetical protein LTR85_005439 [Meristemomyces frigidus]